MYYNTANQNLEIMFKKIKKSIAVFAALLMMSSSLSAYSFVSPGCFEWADQYASYLGFVNGWTHAEEHQVFLIFYDECVNQ